MSLEWLHAVLNLVLHIDAILPVLFQTYGMGIYAILFVIIFCETGLVVMPFLPGDSLLFAAGALAASADVSVGGLGVLLAIAAILGDGVNYFVGRYLGHQLSRSRWVNPGHLARAQLYFERHGTKAVVLARFIPILRTLVPFAAGLGYMNFRRFFVMNVLGGIVWIHLFVWSGFWFGQLPFIKAHFSQVVLGIIVVSFLPIALSGVQAILEKKVR